MGRVEKPFFPPGLRRLPPSDEKHPEIQSLLSTWVRIVIVDGRIFVGSLKAIDNDRNVVLSSKLCELFFFFFSLFA